MKGSIFLFKIRGVKIIAWMNELVKNCKYIINANQDFFKGLSNIRTSLLFMVII